MNAEDQKKVFYEQSHKIAIFQQEFLRRAGLLPLDDGTLEKEPITQEDLSRLIRKFPERYKQFEGFMPLLRSANAL